MNTVELVSVTTIFVLNYCNDLLLAHCFYPCPLQSILCRATAVNFSKHKSDHVTLLLTSFLTASPLASSDAIALAFLPCHRHARHPPVLGLLQGSYFCLENS